MVLTCEEFGCNPGPGFKASTSRVLSLSGRRSLAPRARGSARGPCGGRSSCGRARAGRVARGLVGVPSARARASQASRSI